MQPRQNYGQQRAAQRRQQWGQGPQPTQQQLADINMRRNNPGAYYGRDELSKGRLYGQNREGVITQSGHRINAQGMRDLGYRYDKGKGQSWEEDYQAPRHWVKMTPQEQQRRSRISSGLLGLPDKLASSLRNRS
jgi:hypothetical protein